MDFTGNQWFQWPGNAVTMNGRFGLGRTGTGAIRSSTLVASDQGWSDLPQGVGQIAPPV